MKKRIFSLLLVVLVSCFVVNVNAEIKRCPNDNYDKIKSLSFEDNKEVSLHFISDSIAKIEDGKLIISIATRNDELMNVDEKYIYEDATFKSVGGYYTVQGSGIFIVYALSTEGKVYEVVADYREANENSSYKPEIKETELTGIEQIATPDEKEEFYLIEKPEATPHRVVYAIDKEGNVYTDETMDNGDFCKIENPNPTTQEESAALGSEVTKEEKTSNKLKESIEVPIYMIAILAAAFGIVIGLLIASLIKNKKHE